MIVPGGGISLDGQRWISSRPAFLMPVRVLGALFRRLFLTRLTELHRAGRLAFFGTQADLADRRRFLRHLAPVRKKRFVVYAKPFARVRRDRRRDHGAVPQMRCSKARSRLYTEISSTIVVQLFTRYWNELSTLPKARTICCMAPRVMRPVTRVGPRAI